MPSELLYTLGSACTLRSATPGGLAAVLVRGELDALGYAWPARGGAPLGAMHPVTEVVRPIACRADTAALDGNNATLAQVLYTDEAP